MEIIIDLINTLGFPISVCIALFWMNREMMRSYQLLLVDFKDTLRDNTEVMRTNNEAMRSNNDKIITLVNTIENDKNKNDKL